MPEPIKIRVPRRKTSAVIALDSIASGRIVASGRTMKAVVAKAKKAGTATPIVMVVPRPGSRCIY